eukprot:Blabericola_migrator_1__5688@NODE_2889_length_2236_cov_111_839557_g1813_i0_p1_GENE_NODE_2889_length_2236_cov_111_839557_g1813_i0NODE_2889_length_2236_cov_111_839557_g1813_i0_p1_ORF_typecomplete_len187_score33_31Mpp10/PF04006_12/8_3e30_NODE_2889_length_2236_cov_111_839557_g1813_i063623
MSLRDFEKELLAPKPWQLRGEVDSTSRPKDSLLDEHFQFTRRKGPTTDSKLAAVEAAVENQDPLTVNTDFLERLVKIRICNNLFDNVKPLDKKALTGNDLTLPVGGDTEVLNYEKNSTSLADSYTASTTTTRRAAEEVKRQQDEVLALWSSVERTLDSFCVESYIPKATVTKSAAERAEEDQVKAA